MRDFERLLPVIPVYLCFMLLAPLLGLLSARLLRLPVAEARSVTFRRLFTPIDEIPDLVKEAFVSAEDKNFYEHHGFDPRGIVAAVYDSAVPRCPGCPTRCNRARS